MAIISCKTEIHGTWAITQISQVSFLSHSEKSSTIEKNLCSFYNKGAVRIAIYSDTRIAHGPILFISGQTPQQEAETPADIYTQTKIVLHKIQIILQQHEIDWSAIAKMTVFITDAADLSGLREAFTNILGEIKPAMSLVVVAGLIDPSFKVEIDAQAELPNEFFN